MPEPGGGPPGPRIVGGPFTERQLRAVARLHAAQVSEGFLSSLGEPVLRLLYRHVAVSRHCALFLAYAGGGEPVGYICGTRDASALYREFLRRRWWVAGPAVLPRLLTPKRIVRALETLRYPRVADAGLPRAEILNFVVEPAVRGGGHAGALFDVLMRWFAEQGEPAVKIVTGEQQERAHGFYAKAGARLQGRTAVHRDAPSRVYVYPLENAPKA